MLIALPIGEKFRQLLSVTNNVKIDRQPLPVYVGMAE